MKRTLAGVVLVLAAVLSAGPIATALSADEILDRMTEEADALSSGGMISIIRFENVYRDGTTGSNLFGSLAIPGRSLIYFIEPRDVSGTIFLTHEAATSEERARLWLFLPLLGIPKELVSEDDRGGSFAGSALSYADLADREGRADYDASLLGEEEVQIGEETRRAYKIESIAKPGTDVDEPRAILWVDAEQFIMLRMESYNSLDRRSTTIEVVSLGTFENQLIAAEMLATNHADNSTTVITIVEQRRPAEGELETDLFSPERLMQFDPAAWGFLP